MHKSDVTATPVALLTLSRGEAGWVHAVHGNPDQVARLAGLGVCTGARVEIVRGQDPLILKVCGTRIGIARQLAASILVTTQHVAA